MTRLRNEPSARYRVLILDDHPPGLPATIDTLLTAQLQHDDIDVNVDAIRSPGSALRVIRADPHALDRYDAVIAITSLNRGLLGTSPELHREAEQLATRLPTLLVQVEPTRTLHHQTGGAELRPDSDSTAARLLTIPAHVSVRAAARQIAAALDLLLQDRARKTDTRSQARPLPQTNEIVLRRLQHITRLAREAFDLHAAAVNLVDNETISSLAIAGKDPQRRALNDSLCAIALRRPGITVIPDTHLDADARHVTDTRGQDPVRFYAAVPIHDHAGTQIGTLCLYDPHPHHEADLDFSLLHDLALLAEGELIDTPELIPTHR